MITPVRQVFEKALFKASAGAGTALQHIEEIIDSAPVPTSDKDRARASLFKARDALFELTIVLVDILLEKGKLTRAD